MEFRPFREWNFQFRELLREYPGTLPELREWPFRSESVFPEIGVVPRLLIWALRETGEKGRKRAENIKGRFRSNSWKGG